MKSPVPAMSDTLSQLLSSFLGSTESDTHTQTFLAELAAGETRAHAALTELQAQADLTRAAQADLHATEATTRAATAEAQAAEASLRSTVTELTHAEALARHALTELHQAREQLTHTVEAALAQATSRFEELVAHGLSGAEGDLRRLVDSGTHELSLLARDAEHSLETALGHATGRLDDLTRSAADQLSHTSDDLLRHLQTDVQDHTRQLGATLEQHLGELRTEGTHYKHSVINVRGAIEDIVQIILSEIPVLGPTLSNLADRIDPES